MEDGRKRFPRIVVFDVPEDNSSDVLVKRLHQVTGQGVTEEEFRETCLIKLEHKHKHRQRPSRNIMLVIQPKTRKALEDIKRKKISWLSCKIADCNWPMQCWKCLGFGHGARLCQAKVRCLHCGEEGHVKLSCKNGQKKERCANCRGGHGSRDKVRPAFKAATAERERTVILHDN